MPTRGHDEVVARRKAALSPTGRVQLEVFKDAFSVGAQLARRRHELNLTQADLSARAGRIRSGDFAATPGKPCYFCDYAPMCPARAR